MKPISPKNDSIFRPFEIKAVNYLTRFVPSFIGTKILTMLSLFSSLLMLFCFYLVDVNSLFLFFIVLFLILNWIFDCLDGTIGRKRKEGFIKWGFYMDHLFDYFFLFCLVFGFSNLYNLSYEISIILFFLASSFFVSAVLFYATTNGKDKFNVSFLKLSPIEFRLIIIFILISSYWYFPLILNLIAKFQFYFIFIISIIFVYNVYCNQKKLSKDDMFIKKNY